MNIPKIKIKHTKIAFTILIILLLFCVLSYSYIFYVSYCKESFVTSSLKIAEQNEVSVFKVNRILLYSSGSAIDNSTDSSLHNLDVCQYTDLAIYIDNTSSNSELTSKNTVKELWVDNIRISTANPEVGTQVLNYKDLNTFGTFGDLSSASAGRIDFKIVNTNEENESADYASPTFYTDCSNPISLGYVNKGIVKNYSIHDDVNSVVFNGKILKQAGVDLANLDASLLFDIHIRNHDNDTFVYHANIDIKLNTESKEILGGYLYQSRNNTSGSEYIFFQELS